MGTIELGPLEHSYCSWFLVFLDRVSLCNLEWPGTYRDPRASTSQELEIKTCIFYINIVEFLCIEPRVLNMR